jgi:hypothetical protein
MLSFVTVTIETSKETPWQEITTCLACGSTIIQISGRGHRKRAYCDDRCRQRAHRARATAQEIREQQQANEQDTQARIAELEQEVRKLQVRLDVEARFHMDTEARHFKAWLRKLRRHPGGSFAQRFIADTRLPQQASRAMFEAQLKRLNYSSEDIETFRDLWKAMLLS